ncbi:Sodium channel modifier 1 [Rhynchospora pubera]|uniref:Sodium channel modifier 1 n=1 Tax=Rhynchospora pubera TaxID=906938 RepID=A0AAV8CY13_9POAL|nr:Sodium channel modifier 1 [Rhynchospora pubera]
MSVYGGDSWGREAQQRKRRVDDLLSSSSNASSSFKKLSSGKFVCLVCPHNPVLDSSLMLSVHNKGSRHVAAQAKQKENELWRQQELNKRIALSSKTKIQPKTTSSNNHVKPLVEQTRTTILELQSTKFTLNAKDAASNDSHSSISSRERRQKELKFIAAGWKRDCHGKWFRDENVEFDSDEEDPNVCPL